MNSLLEAITMAFALGTDAFSVSTIIGVKKFNLRTILRLSLVIGFFHIIMPLIGIYGGSFIRKFIVNFFNYSSEVDHLFTLIGAGMLALIGLYFIIETRFDRETEIKLKLEGFGILAIALSVSLDAFSMGVSLGILNFHLWIILLFGFVAGIMTFSGLLLGSRVGHWLGDDVQIWGGLLLIYLGLHFANIL